MSMAYLAAGLLISQHGKRMGQSGARRRTKSVMFTPCQNCGPAAS